MNINNQSTPYFLGKDEEKRLQKLIAKLERFSRKCFHTHYFRGESAGIPPSGDDYRDFVIRAIIHYYPKDGKFIIDQEFEKKLFQYIRREISRESRLRINNGIKNEAYYKERYSEEFHIFESINDGSLSIRERLIELEKRQVEKEIVREFEQFLKDEKLRIIIELFNSEKIGFERMLAKVTDYPIALINELLNDNWIFDFSGQTTENFDKIDRPCKLKVKTLLKGERAKSDLLGILKSNGRPSQPRFIAYSLGMKVEKYQLHVRKIREQFTVFLNQWKAKGNNEEMLKALGLFQDYI